MKYQSVVKNYIDNKEIESLIELIEKEIKKIRNGKQDLLVGIDSEEDQL